MGKSALLGYLAGRVGGWQVATAVGVESEMELDYSGLHQLCAPMLDQLDRLPGPQRDALSAVFGRSRGPAPDRFLVGLATLTLFAEASDRQPLVCIVDDAHWLDDASEQILGFVGRRLLAERIVLVCAARTGLGDDVLTGLPELFVRGLDDSDARAMLLENMHGPLDEAVCDQIIRESHGNPLALLELPRTWSPADLAGGFGLLDGHHPVAGKIEESYARRLVQLPAETQLLVLAAAAEPLGDPVLLHRAATTLGLDGAAVDPAVADGLLTIGGRVEFAHPLVRSASYHSAGAADRRRVHRALAEATDGDADPDRRAWHRGRAAQGPDDEVAAELEHSAGRAQARGGFAAAAVFLDRATELTPDPARRAERALAAAQSKHLAGAPEDALRLLAVACAGRLGELDEARAQLLRAQIAFVTTRGKDAPAMLFDAARRLESFDAALARETYLDAFAAAIFAGRMADRGDVRDVAGAVLAADWADAANPPRASDLLLDGLAHVTTEGFGRGVPRLKRAVEAFRHEPMSDEDALRWLWLACHIARTLGDDACWDELTERQVQVARRSGALSILPAALHERFRVELYRGNLALGSALAHEAYATIEAIGSHESPHGALVLAAWGGRDEEAAALVEAGRDEVSRRGEGMWLIGSEWTRAELFNGLARWDDALRAAEWVAAQPNELGSSTWISAELIEAAVRSGKDEHAAAALERFSELARATGTDWALGIEARSKALLSDGEDAESLYREAIDRLGKTRIRVMLARTHLVYGEWLRRENRRVDAREELRVAHVMFGEMGYEPYAERARRELVATGEKVRRRSAETRDQLTPQEEQIARLARDGLSNPEIGAQLFLSPRTVEWHLRKVFAKLGINSRKGLRTALPKGEPQVTPA